MERYYVTQNGKPVGPWTVDEILKNIKSNAVTWTDYLFDEAKQDWVLLMDHPTMVPHFREVAHQKSPNEAPKKSESAPSPAAAVQDKEWFALKDDNKYGPFTYLDLVKMLQDKKLFEFDYVWNASFTNWKRIAECGEFAADKVRALRVSGHADIEEVFFRRRHARAMYGASLVVHNNKKVWKAESLEIGSGGCGIMLDFAGLEPGQNLFLHFKAGDGVPPFNAICEVVSKKGGSADGYRYGVKFTSISRQVQKAIKDYTDKAS